MVFAFKVNCAMEYTFCLLLQLSNCPCKLEVVPLRKYRAVRFILLVNLHMAKGNLGSLGLGVERLKAFSLSFSINYTMMLLAMLNCVIYFHLAPLKIDPIVIGAQSQTAYAAMDLLLLTEN